MKITVDTNLLPRAAVQDDLRQVHRAAKTLKDNEFVVVPLPILCEFIRALNMVGPAGHARRTTGHK